MPYNVFHDIPHPPSVSEFVRFRTIWEVLDYQEWSGGPVEIKSQILKETDKNHYYLHRSAVFNRMPDINFLGFHYINDIVGIPEELGKSIESLKQNDARGIEKEIQIPELNLRFMVCFEISKIIDQIDGNTNQLVSSLKEDLNELKDVLRIGAFRSVMALCGRSLEVALKVGLNIRGISYNDDWMVGKLLGVYSDHSIYLDPTLKNQLNILNSYRIFGVHVKENQPIPSEQQVLSLVLMLSDCLKRSLIISS